MQTLQIIPDRFSKSTEKVIEDYAVARYGGYEKVRRPTNGIQLNKDTYATLRLVSSKGHLEDDYIPLIDAGSADADGWSGENYSNFILQNASEERAEKQQILETFGEPYIFFFGERARIVNFSGILLNTFDFNWEAEWWANYDRYLRGTRCLQYDAIVTLIYDNTLISGYITAAAATKNSQERNWVNFQFQIFLTSYTTLTALGDPSKTEFGSKALDEKAAEAFRPRLLTDPQYSSSDMGNPNKSLAVSLYDQSTSTFKAVKGAINTATNAVDKFLSNVNAFMNGVTVRVPYGFAGTITMDDNYYVKPVPVVTSTGEIQVNSDRKFFRDNTEEYIDPDSHYEGAAVPRYSDTSWDNLSQQSQVTMIENQFSAAGINSPEINIQISNQVANLNNSYGMDSVDVKWKEQNQANAVATIESSLAPAP